MTDWQHLSLEQILQRWQQLKLHSHHLSVCAHHLQLGDIPQLQIKGDFCLHSPVHDFLAKADIKVVATHVPEGLILKMPVKICLLQRRT